MPLNITYFMFLFFHTSLKFSEIQVTPGTWQTQGCAPGVFQSLLCSPNGARLPPSSGEKQVGFQPHFLLWPVCFMGFLVSDQICWSLGVVIFLNYWVHVFCIF